MDTLMQDLRFAVRTLSRAPGFAVIAILTLAVGIGSNIAIYSVVKAVLLRPIGISQPDRAVMLWTRNRSRDVPQNLVHLGQYNDWRSQAHSFSEMAAATDTIYTLTGSGEPDSLVAWSVEPNFMRVLGAEPELGRLFTAEEGTVGHDHVVLLTDRLWRNKFSADPNIIGKSITLSDTPYTVVGVMKASFNFPSDIDDVWTALALPADMTNRQRGGLRVVARLRDGVTMAQAQSEMDQLSQRLGQRYPDTDKGWDVSFQPVRDMLVGDIRGPLLALGGAVGFVLLIACANIANLLLARGAGRRKEVAIRVALGANRSRVIRQLLTESMLLAGFGCAGGVLLAFWASGLLLQLFPNNIANLNIPQVQSLPLDAGVFAFAIVISLLTGILFGMVPAWQVSGVSPDADLKQGGGRSAADGAGRKLRAALVVAQVSLALVLLVCAGLMIKSFIRLQGSSLGFNPNHVLSLQTFLPRTRYKTDPDRSRFAQSVLDQLKTVPGVQSAGAVNFLPLSGFWGTVSFQTPGMPPAPVAQWPAADYRIASKDYFSTMQIPVLRGRGFTDQDTPQSQLVCIINQTFAQRFFPHEDPVGKFVTPDPDGFGKVPFQIIGVIGDVKHFGAAETTHAELYRPFTQDGFPLIAFTVRTGNDPMAVADAARRAVWSVDKDQAISRVLSMDEAASQSEALRRISTVVLGFFGATALALAVLGIYGVMSYLVSQRTREIGIRVALGAQRHDVLGMVLGQSLTVVLIGLGAGLVAAFFCTRLLTSLLFNVRPFDIATFAAVPFVLCAAAMLASYVPALRAARVDPMQALRYE